MRTNPTSAAAASRARPARALAAVLPQEPLPPHLAFDLDEELAVLEAQTKVRVQEAVLSVEWEQGFMVVADQTPHAPCPAEFAEVAPQADGHQ